MSDPLVTVEDLIERHGQVATMDVTEVRGAISDASAAVRSFTGQTLTVATSTHRLEVRNGRVTVPQRPIVEVTAITDRLGTAVMFEITNENTIDVRTQVFDTWSMVPYSSPLEEVDVTYRHGFDPMHEAITAVVCQIVLRTLTSPVEDSGLTETHLGSYGEHRGTVGASGPSGLFSGEKDILRQFKRPLRSMRVAGA